jgi:hypothetical protein
MKMCPRVMTYILTCRAPSCSTNLGSQTSKDDREIQLKYIPSHINSGFLYRILPTKVILQGINSFPRVLLTS